jgi:hypothetical protein
VAIASQASFPYHSGPVGPFWNTALQRAERPLLTTRATTAGSARTMPPIANSRSVRISGVNSFVMPDERLTVTPDEWPAVTPERPTVTVDERLPVTSDQRLFVIRLRLITTLLRSTRMSGSTTSTPPFA